MRRLLIPNICGLPSEGRKVLRRGTEAPTPRATPSGGAIAGPNFSSMQSAWRMLRLKLANIMNILKKFLMTHGIQEKSPIPQVVSTTTRAWARMTSEIQAALRVK